MDAQIRLQLEAAQHLRELRREHGALELETIQASPVINDNGQVTELSVVERNSARDLIENFMIAAKTTVATTTLNLLKTQEIMERNTSKFSKDWRPFANALPCISAILVLKACTIWCMK